MRRERVLLLALAVLAALVWFAAAAPPRPLTLTFLDVGQGDSLLIQTPDGRAVLVDGGGRPGVDSRAYDIGRQVVLPSLLVQGVRRLNAVVVTHAHEDHCGGLGAVVSQLPTDWLLVPAAPDSDLPGYQRLLALARERQIKVRPLRAGMSLYLGKGISCQVLAPPRPPLLGTDADENNNSVVLLVRYGRFRALLPGDIERPAEEWLVARRAPLRCVVLKVAHHGSSSSTTTAFLQAARPQAAVISVAQQNPFGHPHRDTLLRLQRSRVRVYRTDWQGAITVTSDGVSCHIRTTTGRPQAFSLN